MSGCTPSYFTLVKYMAFPNENYHLLKKDGHNSHVTLDVVHTAPKVGLDVLIVPRHTSHAT